MNTAKRLQLLLSPVLIAMLALMLAVVSFGWYQATFDGEITVEDSSVNIIVSEPEGTNVALAPIGDDYTYSGGIYTLKSNNAVGYFGQTAEYDVSSTSLDKPYIAFYRVSIETTEEAITISDAYVSGVKIVDSINQEVVLFDSIDQEENYSWTSETSEFKVCFYSLVEENDESKLKLEADSFTPSGTEMVVYMGVHFDKPSNTGNENREAFAYSDIQYYGSIYQLQMVFE